mmetsp:Transcript_30095/g.79505  ORF Transcript_30095/g.79505 Transcript_30095/m.79505 type:complete len:108 (-) Transcript_30095:65-388(-)
MTAGSMRFLGRDSDLNLLESQRQILRRTSQSFDGALPRASRRAGSRWVDVGEEHVAEAVVPGLRRGRESWRRDVHHMRCSDGADLARQGGCSVGRDLGRRNIMMDHL